ncbi:MAG: ATP-binding protein [Dermatophilaceae bacterium]
MAAYRPRVVDTELAERMRSAGAVLVEGPKACGKTATAQRVAASVFRVDTDDSARSLVDTAPEVLMAAPPPVLFDEWQVAPKLWNLVRRQVDDLGGDPGRFVLTGSSTPRDDVSRHSGAGRFSVLHMRPMSLFETGVSTGAVSLAGLFDGDFTPGLDPGVTVPALVECIVRGGWPSLLDAPVRTAQRWVGDYVRTIVEVDMPQMGVRRDPIALRRLLASLGRATGTDMSTQAIANDVAGSDRSMPRDSVAGYLDVLSRLMITEDVPAWAPHMRSTTPLRKAPTRFLTDPSLGVAALGVGPEQLLQDLNATGFHFEALAVRDLRTYAQPLGGQLAHWRDNNQHEVDIVITLDDGRWAALEVKMNPDAVDTAAGSLLRFKNKVDTSRAGEPSFLGVVTTRSAAVLRTDGVYVLPIASLGP